jgi:hypothetical protein
VALGEGTVHHVAFDAGSLDNQMELRLGTEFMLPPWLEDRRAELMGRLETIDTAGT